MILNTLKDTDLQIISFPHDFFEFLLSSIDFLYISAFQN